jgi:hypothetical protein
MIGHPFSPGAVPCITAVSGQSEKHTSAAHVGAWASPSLALLPMYKSIATASCHGSRCSAAESRAVWKVWRRWARPPPAETRTVHIGPQSLIWLRVPADLKFYITDRPFYVNFYTSTVLVGLYNAAWLCPGCAALLIGIIRPIHAWPTKMQEPCPACCSGVCSWHFPLCPAV